MLWIIIGIIVFVVIVIACFVYSFIRESAEDYSDEEFVNYNDLHNKPTINCVSLNKENDKDEPRQ